MRIHARGTSPTPPYGDVLYWAAVVSIILGVVALALMVISPGYSKCVIKHLLKGASTEYIRYNCTPTTTIDKVGEVLARLIFYILPTAPIPGIILSVYKTYRDKTTIALSILYLVAITFIIFTSVAH